LDVIRFDPANNGKAAGSRILPRLTVIVVTLLAFAAAIILWQPYAETIFFETVRAGFVACFG
jgi:hypothetical protein